MLLSRRKLLSLSAATAIACQSQNSLASLSIPAGDKTLSLLNLHTGERVKAAFWQDGEYQLDALLELNHFFRDHRNNHIINMDRQLLESIHNLSMHMDYDGEIHIISGYRSPETNEMLLRKGHRVSKRSMHLQGRAIDLRIPKTDLKDVRRAALGLHQGGVGYYPNSNFIHLDTGRTRQWG